ncbi:J domain-containing protein [Pseudanabaena sp. PCC 6802]|uniref:J domain-containing protein n=1 Tax=Pseudanabaena sp. PCC 6802 TaxID=118173 RepID=UPI0003641276|nr:J domain-containing protein [Pseudanabaena sp. PCC 6802]
MQEPSNYYEILGVPQNASSADIKAAYYRLVRKYHPDLNQTDLTAQDKFCQVTEAYQVLNDPERRLVYDRLINNLNNARPSNAQAGNPTQDAETAYTRGLDKLNRADCREAIAHFTEAIALHASYTAAYNCRGLAYYKLGDSASAIIDYTQAIRLNPDFAEAYYNRGLARFRLGYSQAAIEDFTKAGELQPNYGQAYYRRGLVYVDLDDRTHAIADLQMAVEAFTACSDLPGVQLAQSTLQSLKVKHKSRQIVSKTRELIDDTRMALGNFIPNPLGGMLPVYARLTVVRAVRLSICIAVIFNLCFTIGAYMLWRQIYNNTVPTDKLIFTGGVVFLGFAVSSFVMRSFLRGRGSFVGDLFIAGASLLPIGALVLLSGLVGVSHGAIALAIFAVFSISYAILTAYSGCNQISNMSESASTLSVPTIFCLTGFILAACIAWMRPMGIRPDGLVTFLMGFLIN